MPYVQVTWVAGRTPEQKRKLAERITQALIEDGRAKRENIQVTFVDLPADRLCRGWHHRRGAEAHALKILYPRRRPDKY